MNAKNKNKEIFMIYKSIKSVLFLTLFLCTHIGIGQQSKMQIKGEQFLKKEKYTEAIEYFSTVDSLTRAQDPLYNYYYGMAYYYSPDKKELAIPYLEKYLSQSDSNQISYYSHQHVYYVLGKTYHLTYDFEKAKGYYGVYISHIQASISISAEEKATIIASTKREIEQCKFGQIAVNNPRNVVIENLGDTINSIYPEYASVVSQDEKILIFTSRRPDTQGGKKIPNEGFMEDIYRAQMSKGSLYEPRAQNPDSTKGYYFSLVTDFEYDNFKNLGSKINSKGHDGSIQLGVKDSLLYFYRDSDIWSINMYDTLVEKPSKMGMYVNSEEHEPSLFFSYDGKKLLIVSDRPGGYGGLDIYISENQGGSNWSEPVNLGPNINTEYDEDAPYLDPDGKTLYFSSMGNSSIGEYDIFRSRLSDTTWSSPVNMGYPINTTSDDIYFTMTSRYNRGYYSSGRLEGKGDMDLYRITFSDERDPIAELVGFVKKGDKLTAAQSIITMRAIAGEEEISQETDSIVGDYFLLLGHGKKYEMLVETEGFAPYKRVIEIPEQREYFQLYQEVHHVYLYDSDGNIIGQKITLINAIGGVDSTSTYYDEETLAKFELLKNKLGYDFDVNALTDVKFYMSMDSLLLLMEEDSIMDFNFSDSTNVAFLVNNDSSKYDLDSYIDYSGSLKRVDLFPEDSTSNIDPKSNDFAMATDVKNIKGLFYTVQIGVYKNQVTPDILLNIQPLNIQKTDNGNLRYTTGVFVDIPNATVRKNEIVDQGVIDAYVTAYYNGERVSMAEARRLIEQEGVQVLFNSDANMILNRR